MIEQKFGRLLLYLAYRHHIMEILLECMISKSLEPSSGPKIRLFQRIKAEWEIINQEEYSAVNLEPEPETKHDNISFCSSQLEEYHPLDDYKEFFTISHDHIKSNAKTTK